jgi:biotin carboxyl carrier protein
VSDTTDNRVEVTPLGNGRYQVVSGTQRRIAYAVAARNVAPGSSRTNDLWVFIDGRAYTLADPSADAPRKSRVDDEAALTAPMPATVLAINVAPGQRVERNDVLMVLEAMKMELPVRSPRDGVVKSLGCQVGELVQPGTTLLHLEEPAP